MKIKHIIDLDKNPVKHKELKLFNMYDNKINWGKKYKLETRDVIVRDTKTGTIYGRRAIVQKRK